MTRQILHRWTGAVLWSGEAETVKDAICAAVAARAVLTGADLTGAVLTGADLRGADLTGADLTAFRDDVWAVLSSAPAEAPAVLDAIRAGTVDGSCYEGACASRLAEVWFAQIAPGQTPENHAPAKIAAEWIETWLVNMRAAFANAPSRMSEHDRVALQAAIGKTVASIEVTDFDWPASEARIALKFTDGELLWLWLPTKPAPPVTNTRMARS